MQEWGVASGEAVDVGVDEHLVVEAVDAVVKGGAVDANGGVGGVGQGFEEGQGVAGLGGDGFAADAFFFASAGEFAGCGVADEDADLGAAFAFGFEGADEAGVVG